MTRLYTVVCIVCLLALSVANADSHCVVLQYQHISDDQPGIVSVTPEQFAQHLAYLADNHYQVLPLKTVVAALRDAHPLPEHCVALTIDGGYSSAYLEALPLVAEYGFPLTLFVATAPIDAAQSGYLSWSQMRDMQALGVSFQSQGSSGEHLIRHLKGESQDDWEQRVAADIQLGNNRLAQELGEPATLFAYPFGEYNLALKQIIESMQLAAFGVQSGPLWQQADLAALPRFSMNSLAAQMRSFPTKINSLPLPITGAFPDDPEVSGNDWRPSLTLVFAPNVANQRELSCFLNGSPEVVYQWLEEPENSVVISPKGRLNVGRNRVHCTLPGKDPLRVGWFARSWLRPNADGNWE